jgi:NifB/MoaA-like Fe-S oxidoreductase
MNDLNDLVKALRAELDNYKLAAQPLPTDNEFEKGAICAHNGAVAWISELLEKFDRSEEK